MWLIDKLRACWLTGRPMPYHACATYNCRTDISFHRPVLKLWRWCRERVYHLKTCTLNKCSSPPPVRHPVVPLTIKLWPKKSPSPPSPCTQRCEEPPATAPINATVMYSTVGEMSVEFQSPGSPAAMHHPDCDCVCWRANCRRKRLSRESLCAPMCVHMIVIVYHPTSADSCSLLITKERRESRFIFIITINMAQGCGRIKQVSQWHDADRIFKCAKLVVVGRILFVLESYSKRPEHRYACRVKQ